MQQFGRYLVESEIGRGHWGPIYCATDPLLGRQVAIESFTALANGGDQESAALRQRLLQQVRSVARLTHPNLIVIYEMGDQGATPFLATELLRGDTLQIRLANGPLRPERAVSVLRPVAEALDYAHGNGVVHCAVEPKNVFVGAQGGVKLTELSFAAISGTRRPPAAAGKWLGSPHYMAPEQFRADPLDGRTDQYALAVMTFEMLTGSLPYSGPSAHDLMRQVTSGEIPAASSLARLPKAVDIVLRKALAKAPDERFESCTAFADALALAIEGEGQRTLGGFLLEEELGQGAMGKVYRAMDPVMRREVAIKTILPDPRATRAEVEARQQELQVEARHASKLSHPHVVTIYGFGNEEDASYIVMELVSGVSLEQALSAGPLDAPRACRILSQIAEALDAAHEQNILHRDVKPANLLLGAHDFVKVTDFGISRNLAGGGDASGLTMGTLFYMAPEQINGEKLDGRCDQFSLAVTAYRVLTGSFPFYSESAVGVMGRILLADAQPAHTVNPGLPPKASSILQRALSKKRTERYPTCTAFVSELCKVLEPGVGVRILGRFEPDRDISAGWIGTVRLCRDTSLGRRVTIQEIDFSRPVINPEVVAFQPSFDQRRFPGLSIAPRAMKNAAALSHPNIIVIYEVVQEKQMGYTVMEPAPEQTLEDLLSAGPVEPNRLRSLLWQAAAGLDYMHGIGLLHRNVKPCNLLVWPGDLVKLKDFTISQRMTEPAQDIVGTPGYLSPEQCNGMPLDSRSDQFSLAVTAYRALTAKLPFAAPTVEGLLAKIVLFDAPSVIGLAPHLTPYVDVVLGRALAKKPEQRYATCAEFVSTLAEALAANQLW